jgi:hypothetical protein
MGGGKRILGGLSAMVATGKNYIKYGVWLHSVFIVYLIIVLSFLVNMKFLYGVHKPAFRGGV